MPWQPSEKLAGKSGAEMYGDFVMMVDARIGRVLASLDEMDISRETLATFTSDNGPVWNPADKERFGHDSSGGLRGMKGDAWEGGNCASRPAFSKITQSPPADPAHSITSLPRVCRYLAIASRHPFGEFELNWKGIHPSRADQLW